MRRRVRGPVIRTMRWPVRTRYEASSSDVVTKPAVPRATGLPVGRSFAAGAADSPGDRIGMTRGALNGRLAWRTEGVGPPASLIEEPLYRTARFHRLLYQAGR